MFMTVALQRTNGVNVPTRTRLGHRYERRGQKSRRVAGRQVI